MRVRWVDCSLGSLLAGFERVENETHIFTDLDLSEGSYALGYVGSVVALAPVMGVDRDEAEHWAKEPYAAASQGRFFSRCRGWLQSAAGAANSLALKPPAGRGTALVKFGTYGHTAAFDSVRSAPSFAALPVSAKKAPSSRPFLL